MSLTEELRCCRLVDPTGRRQKGQWHLARGLLILCDPERSFEGVSRPELKLEVQWGSLEDFLLAEHVGESVCEECQNARDKEARKEAYQAAQREQLAKVTRERRKRRRAGGPFKARRRCQSVCIS